MIHGTGESATSVHVSEGWKNWMLTMMAKIVKIRVGPAKVMRRTGLCVHRGESDVSES